MASRKSDGSDAWRGAAAQPNGASALAYGGPGYAAPATYGAQNYSAQGYSAQAVLPQPPAAEPPWLVLVGGSEQRPMPAAALRAAVQSGAVALETLVWRAGMSAWAPIGSIGELVQLAPAAAPAASAWEAPLAQGPTAAQQAAEQYLSTRGPGLGDTTTYAAWDPPQGRVPLRRAAPPPANITSELLATGLVVFGIVMFTLYVISLGGAFTAGSTPAHGAEARHASK